MGMEFCLPFGLITVGAFYVFAGISRWDLSKLEKMLPKRYVWMWHYLIGNSTRWGWQIGLGIFMLVGGLYTFYLAVTGQF